MEIVENTNKLTLNEEIFVVIIMSYFGDALVGNALFFFIINIYPNSKTVFIINKQYYEVAKYQKDVDEVFVFDKNKEHKGILGLFKFVKNFPYKKIKYIFKMCRKTRVDILSFLLRPEKIINYDDDISIPTHERYCNLLKKVTDKNVVSFPIIYNAENTLPEKFQDVLKKDKKYIALCAVASSAPRDMPIETAVELISKLKLDGYSIVLVGVGERCIAYVKELEKNNCEFINLVDSTTIYELARVLRNCKCLISVDTGPMHLGYANNVPTICCFYDESTITGWAPDKKLYPHTILPEDNSSKGIYEAYKSLTSKA